MKHILVLLIPSLLLIISCKDSDNPVNPGNGGDKITTGDVVNLTTQSIGIGGGTITISKPGDPLDEFEMTIPPNSFSQSQSFQISYAPIVKHQLGENFNPISPMIKISCDESFSSHAIKIKIPIKLPANHFASGFFYNENTQTLEIIPSIELTDSSITVIIQSLSSNKKLGKSSVDAKMNLIISSIIESALDNGAVLSTGFEPGYDDWEFQNSGSYVFPGGHATGQSMSAIYYYYEKKLKGNGDPLYHKFDLINDKSTLPPKLWQDNPRGIRLASVMSHECIAEWDANPIPPEVIEYLKNHTLVWKLFIHGIIVTGIPQIIAVVRTSAVIVALAMVVYKVNLSEKKLYVSDPNYPSQVGTIAFQNGVLGPYKTKTKDGEPELLFDQVGFMGVSAVVKWSKLTERYNQFEDGTIGNDIFPSYKLYVESTSGGELTDGMTVTNPTLKIVCKSDKCESFIGGTDKLQPIEIFNKDGDPITNGDFSNQGVAAINLNQGANKIGIYIQGIKSDGNGYYVDFKWVTVNLEKLILLDIAPNPLNGETNKEYTFAANPDGQLPQNIKYVWTFQSVDVTYQDTIYNNNTIKYTFTKAGTYSVHCDIYDNSTNKLLAYGDSKAYITTTFVSNLRNCQGVLVSFNALLVGLQSDNSYYYFDPLTISNDYNFYGYKISWTGLTFSVNYDYINNDAAHVTGTMNGTVSSDGKTITNFSAEDKKEYNSGSFLEQKIQVNGLPYNNEQSTGYNYGVEGLSTQGYIASVSMKKRIYSNYTHQWEEINLTYIHYDSPSSIPYIYINFIK